MPLLNRERNVSVDELLEGSLDDVDKECCSNEELYKKEEWCKKAMVKAKK
jgi:hypothetical protein